MHCVNTSTKCKVSPINYRRLDQAVCNIVATAARAAMLQKSVLHTNFIEVARDEFIQSEALDGVSADYVRKQFRALLNI